MTLPFCAYASDLGTVFAVRAGDEQRAVMGFLPVSGPTKKLPRGLRPRVEMFVSNAAGETVFERYPSPGAEITLGSIVTLRGDPTYTAFATLSEKGAENG